MKNIVLILSGTLGVLIGLGLVFPALAQLRTQGSLAALGVVLLMLGVALSLGGLATAVAGLRSRIKS